MKKEDLFARSRPLNIGIYIRMATVLALVMVSVFAWANWARLDEQVRAQGKVIVSSRSQIVQAVDGGVLQKMHVRQGDFVKAGQLLAELDRARFAASAQEIRSKAVSLQADVERLEAELNGETEIEFSDTVLEDVDLVERQRGLHQRRMRLQREQRESIEASKRLAQEELEALQELARTGDAAQTELLSARRRVVDLQAELVNSKNEYQREAQQQLADTAAELEQVREVLKQRDEALSATYIKAPMDGTVKNVQINTIGAVLKAGDEVLQIVPADEPLLVEARVYSKDVAFVRPGQKANVKLDAYDFTVYGSLKGEVTYVSPDTIDEELKQNEDPYYRALIEITEIPERTKVDAVEIIPGMTNTIEIITGNKTVMQYLLKPLRRGSAAALTER